MQGRLGTTLLWLFVINLGIAFGAGLYEHRIVVGRWLTSAGSPVLTGVRTRRAWMTPAAGSGRSSQRSH